MSPFRDTRPQGEPISAYSRVRLDLTDGRGELTAMVTDLRYTQALTLTHRRPATWELHLEACYIPDAERPGLLDLGLVSPGSLTRLPLHGRDRDRLMEWYEVEVSLRWEPAFAELSSSDPDRIIGAYRSGSVVCSLRRALLQHLGDRELAVRQAPDSRSVSTTDQ